jgi:hypothetical protein
MASIHIARNHQPFGTFSEDEIREGIVSGRFVSSDLCWREGMNEWKLLGEMAPQWGMETPAPALVPVASASANDPLIVVEGSEPAWEDRERIGFFPAIARTVSAVLMRPSPTFAAMKQTGGLANPLLYFVLLSSSMFAVSVLYQIAATSLSPEIFGKGLPHTSKTAFSVALFGSVLISPALYVLSAFISSGITHLSLKALGGANRPFETTFRVICYAQASAMVFNLLPMFGGLLGVIWGAYCVIIGLKETNGITGLKATLAITLPGLLCCGVLLLLGAAAGISIAEMSKLGH